MTTISTWSHTDKPESFSTVAREFAAVWFVHFQRSFRLIKGA